MRDAPVTMAKVIAKAVKDAGWRFGYTHSKMSSKPATDHIAAAVTAHALGDESLAKATRAACQADGSADPCDFPDCGCTSRPVMVRAAIAAALDATGGRDGGE